MQSNESLKGRTALVTGATSGIGAAIAEEFAANGASLVINGLGDATTINENIIRISKYYRVACVYSDADLRNADAVTEMFAMAKHKLGAVEILVNNAGVQHVSPIQDFSDAEWDRVISTNLSACFRTSKAALPSMLAENWGRIINIASVHGLVASVNKCAYVAAKHGVVGLTKVIALETASSGVTCNAICPGWVRTPLVEAQIKTNATVSGRSVEEEADRLVAEKTPSGRFASMQSIADLTMFLCSESASEMTGGQYTIDGGWSAR
jgi:3-hydroxybutyrate dehydrogenase